ncbi:hypothetical protein [Butyrivibrio hungatei]|uniref:N-acetyltransferase domain-containing protein n=1 Tax=Butyrivibrio hungatei TaxID=185008 RepID=A0A1D9P0R1_9FIRM|nr:hypothetical protein [Butyrivibrio hungatei]AOZ96071.1 hypothetical protein bhn_I1037 [Butyrivibrio hungatei]
MNPNFYDLYECRHLCKNDIDKLHEFTVRKDGGNLANYLDSQAIYDEEEHNARVYLVIDKETQEIAGYFALKAGFVAVHAKRNLFSKEFDSVPGVELANFAVNSSYIQNHENRKGLGAAMFEYCILPIARQAQEIIGIKFIYIFALPYQALIKRYETYGFARLNKLQERNTHLLIRPRYDEGCTFMYQTL